MGAIDDEIASEEWSDASGTALPYTPMTHTFTPGVVLMPPTKYQRFRHWLRTTWRRLKWWVKG